MDENPLQQALRTVTEHRQPLARALAREALEHYLAAPNELQLAALLGALATRGETEDELAGFVDTLRTHAIRIPVAAKHLVDTCGTGGDRSGTFNISTAAALVAAAAGATVAKHGNRAITSQSGSSDVLEALGIPIDHTPASAAAALSAHRFAFLAAPTFQPAMRAVLPVRRALGIRTAFNLLGPLTNPAGAPAQVIGVYSAHLVPVVANTLARLGARHAFVVHGMGMDEFTVTGPTIVGEVIDGEAQFGTLTPDAFGLPTHPVDSLAGGTAQQNAHILEQIFVGQPGPHRDVVVMNAAAVLVVAGLAFDFPSGALLAQQTIDSGVVSSLVKTLATPPEPV